MLFGVDLIQVREVKHPAKKQVLKRTAEDKGGAGWFFSGKQEEITCNRGKLSSFWKWEKQIAPSGDSRGRNGLGFKLM